MQASQCQEYPKRSRSSQKSGKGEGGLMITSLFISSPVLISTPLDSSLMPSVIEVSEGELRSISGCRALEGAIPL